MARHSTGKINSSSRCELNSQLFLSGEKGTPLDVKPLEQLQYLFLKPNTKYCEKTTDEYTNILWNCPASSVG